MKYRSTFAFLLLAVAAFPAEPNPKSPLVAEIMRAYGVEEMLESTRLEMIKQATGALQTTLGQVKQGMPQMSEEGWAKIRAAADKYTNAALSGWDGASLTKIYAQIYEDNYSLEELTALADYVKTEKATKSIRVQKTASKMLNEAIMSETAKSLQPALQTFMAEIQAIVRDEVKRIQQERAKQTSTPPAAPSSSPN